MSKTTLEITDDCGLDETRASLLKQIMSEPDNNETYEGVVESIIGALYRRIEKLEEEKEVSGIAAKQLIDLCDERMVFIKLLEADNETLRETRDGLMGEKLALERNLAREGGLL